MADITSMTGFGVGAAEVGGVSARVEIKSVNNRGLKVSIRSRPGLGVCEKLLRDIVAERLVRGSVDVYVNFERSASAEACPLRAEAAKESLKGLRRLALELGLPDTLTARDLLFIPGIFDTSGEESAAQEEWPAIGAALEEALGQVCEMRIAEGCKLTEVLDSLAAPLEEFVEKTAAAAPLALERAREKLRTRLSEICPNGFTPGDAQALERELCLIADKADIAEELDRLGSHIAQYRAALKKGGEIGKRMEFLAQEFLREINTTASKTNDTEIVQDAVQAKLAVEKIKEQSANLV